MKKIFLYAFICLAFSYIYAQGQAVQPPVDSLHTSDSVSGKWIKDGNVSFHLTEHTFTNWSKSGKNALSTYFLLNVDFNKRINEKYVVLNSLNINFDYNIKQGEKPHAKHDNFLFSSIVGRNIKKNLYANAEGTFKTQFIDSYVDHDFPNLQFRTLNGAFLSPAILKFSLGVMLTNKDFIHFEKNKNKTMFYATINPVAVSLFFIADDRLRNKGFYHMKEVGDGFAAQFGFSASANYNFDIIKHIRMQNNLHLFGSYADLEEYFNVGLLSNIYYTLNNWLSAGFNFDVVYYPSQQEGVQFRQNLGIGLNYNLNPIDRYKKRNHK